jgi:diadenosine tetraphosphatase ApaH/serine/threonine PP2A family protein phosphatase
MSDDLVDLFWSAFDPVLSCGDADILAIGASVSLPHFTVPDIVGLCELALAHFTAQPMVVRVPAEVCVVGDIHGTFHDLVRIFRDQGLGARYLFLGDYVDRGAFSLEVIVLLFTLMLRCPDRFVLLRGNHEVRRVCQEYGFYGEIIELNYPECIFDAFCEAFAWMPVAAVVQDAYLCVHGGIGPTIEKICQIEAIPRPIHVDSDVTAVRMILWADPTDASVAFAGSSRGSVLSYGPLAVKPFLQANSLTGIIRAHQCVSGVQPMRTMPVFTVFSSSNYHPDQANDAGILIVGKDGDLTPKTFPALPRIARGDCTFFSFGRSDGAPRLPLGRAGSMQFGVQRLPRLPSIRVPGIAIGTARKPGVLGVPLAKPVLATASGRRASLGFVPPGRSALLGTGLPAVLPPPQQDAIPEEP